MKDYNDIPFKNAAIDRLTSMTTSPNRGDRMVARGQNKMAKAESKLDKRVFGAEEKASEKVRKLSNKFGEAPKYNQSERLRLAKSKLESAEYDTDKLIMLKNLDQNKNKNVRADNKFYAQDMYNGAIYKGGVKNKDLKGKFRKGEGLVKKGEMLSKHINAKRK